MVWIRHGRPDVLVLSLTWLHGIGTYPVWLATGSGLPSSYGSGTPDEENPTISSYLTLISPLQYPLADFYLEQMAKGSYHRCCHILKKRRLAYELRERRCKGKVPSELLKPPQTAVKRGQESSTDTEHALDSGVLI